MSDNFKFGCVIAAIVAAVLLLVGWLAYTPVQYGTVKAVKRFGGLTGQVLQPGFNLRFPFVDSLVTLKTQRVSYEASDNPDSSKADYTDYPVEAQTVDGQQISVKYTVLFRVPQDPSSVINIIQNIGDMKAIVENVIKANSRSLVRVIAQEGFTAEQLYGEDVLKYQAEVYNSLTEKFANLGYGVVLEDFLVRKIEFDADYIAAIENQQIEQEKIETASYQAQAAEFERNRQITLAEAEKQRNILLAEADAQRTVLEAQADAEAIKLKGEALKNNPQVLQFEFVQNLTDVKWGFLPSDSVTPFLPIEAPVGP